MNMNMLFKYASGVLSWAIGNHNVKETQRAQPVHPGQSSEVILG
jgi:hypothetical protein